MLRPERKRALYGYMAGSGLVVSVICVLSGPLFPLVLVFGFFTALVCGVFIVMPAYALLERFGQIRPWWAALLGAVLMIWAMDGGPYFSVGLGAMAGLVGWVVAYGFRIRPEDPAA